MYYVYILQSLLTGEYYKGFTHNFDKRLKQHQLGKVTSTKSKLPLQAIHVELCNTIKEARSLEKYLKSGYGREMIEEIAAHSSRGGGMADAQVSKTCEP